MMSSPPTSPPPAMGLRKPEDVMRLASMGSFHQTRLSFMRVLMRRMAREGWQFDRPVWDVDEQGTGRALYRMKGPERTYTLIAFAHDLPDDQRSDRVIAQAWDATFTLYDGEPTEAEIKRLEANVPLQEAGRISGRELTLSRANRSMRLFPHVVACLAAGRQPDRDEIEAVGYLMRTTAVYGSGKFGAADRAALAARPETEGPFQAEMLTVYLIRAFTIDMAEHLACAKNPNAARLSPALRRRLGVGNSTGLGMAPFLIRHPVLIDHWIRAREEALARVRAVPKARLGEKDTFRTVLAAALLQAGSWKTDHPLYAGRIAALVPDLKRLTLHVRAGALDGAYPWDRLYRWGSDTLGDEARELIVSLMMEPYGELIDGLADCMAADEVRWSRLEGRMTCGALLDAARDVYAFTREINFDDPEATARCWYISEEKQEPRLGNRHEEPIAPYEQPLAPAWDAALLIRALEKQPATKSVAAFVMSAPEHRGAALRTQITARFPYAEIRDNTIDAGMLPIDLLRCKLSFLGATKFDPRSDRWVRITLYQGAPLPDEIIGLSEAEADAWAYAC